MDWANCGKTVLGVAGSRGNLRRLAGRPGQGPPAEKMQMEVFYGLAAFGACIDDDSVSTFRYGKLICDL